MSELLHCLVCASEKAANIARACRSEPALFELLVEEKTGEDKNAKFDQDFKTLADVLIQETVRHDVSQKFPALSESIFGEESNKFTNKLGESLVVSVQADENATKVLLTKVLNDNEEAAQLLAKQVHTEICMDVNVTPDHEKDDECFDIDDIGIWIDPIDATSQYIKGGNEDVAVGFLPTKGLQVFKLKRSF
jgi:inositol polyphosphate 1-phosphatase